VADHAWRALVLYFDGACEPNPGGVASWGWVRLPEGGGGPIEEGCGIVGEGDGITNNVAEYYALGHGLRAITDEGLRPARLTIRGDSKLAVHLAQLRDRCRELLQALGCEWSAVWIPREENTLADALSVKAWCERTGKPFPERRR
jgi:ribonuclease HI